MNKHIATAFEISALLAVFAIGTAAAAAGQPATTDNPSTVESSEMKPLVDALSALKGGTPSPVRINQAIAAWRKLSEPEKERLRNEIVFMACAGFLATGDMASFGKARSGIVDMEAFQAETTERCRECDGSGTLKSRCPSCHGSGECSRCDGRGRLSAERLSGMGAAASRTCPGCHGSGRCPDCNGGTRETRHNPCNGSGKRISQTKCRSAFETHRANAAEEAFAITQEAKGLVLRDGEWVSAAEEKERRAEELRQAEEKRKRDKERRAEKLRQAEEKRKRDKEFADSQRARGLVLINGEWMTPGSRHKAVLTVMQKLQIEGWTMRRAPLSGEHGGLLCLDSVGEVGCIIVSDVEWDDAQEGRRCRFDRLYRCGNFSYTTKAGEEKTVRLYATDLDAALEELDDQRYSQQF